MCEPATIMLMTTIASAGLGIVAQSDQAKAVNDSARQQAEAVNKSTVDSYAQLNRQGTEDAANAAVDAERIRRETVARVATGKTAAAGAGISGLSVDALLLDLSGKGLQAGTTSDMNYARTVDARIDQGNALQSRGAAQVSSIKTARGPGVGDYLNAGMKVANGYADFSKAQSTLNIKGKT